MTGVSVKDAAPARFSVSEGNILGEVEGVSVGVAATGMVGVIFQIVFNLAIKGGKLKKATMIVASAVITAAQMGALDFSWGFWLSVMTSSRMFCDVNSLYKFQGRKSSRRDGQRVRYKCLCRNH